MHQAKYRINICTDEGLSLVSWNNFGAIVFEFPYFILPIVADINGIFLIFQLRCQRECHHSHRWFCTVFCLWEWTHRCGWCTPGKWSRIGEVFVQLQTHTQTDRHTHTHAHTHTHTHTHWFMIRVDEQKVNVPINRSTSQKEAVHHWWRLLEQAICALYSSLLPEVSNTVFK